MASILVTVTGGLTWLAASNRSKETLQAKSNELAQDGGPSSNKLAQPNLDSDKNHSTTRQGVRIRRMVTELSPVQRRAAEFRDYADVASATGDFGPLANFFEGLNQTERYEYFKQIPAIFTKLGPSNDIREKLSLLEKVNASASSLISLRDTVLQMEARERYGQMKEEGILTALSDKEFAGICRSIASSRVKQGFAAVDDAGSEAAKRAAAAEVARCAIAGGAMEASKEIGNLPPGIVRDEAAAELVIWLRRTGSADEADPWLKTITDEKAKVRLNPPKK